MVGCCSQRGKEENETKLNCGPIKKENSNNKCVPGASGGNGRGRHVSAQHDEEVCHGTGERRRDLLDQIKIYLNEFDERPCTVTPKPEDMNALGSYPEYLKKHCQSWMPPNPRPPLITSVQTHEIRATSDYGKMVGETSEYVSFKDATLQIPVFTCDCVKRNGLQDQCPHPMCKPPTAQCRATNPGPCCPPSLGLGGPEAVLGGSKNKDAAQCPSGGREIGQYQGTPRTEYQEAYLQGRAAGNCQQGGQQHQPGTHQAQQAAYITTYRQDYRDHQSPQPFHPQQHPHMPQPPPGMEMACVCKAPSSALPSGKKYLCIPLPQ